MKILVIDLIKIISHLLIFPKDIVRLFLYKYDLLEKKDLYYRILFLKSCAESQASTLGRLAKVFLAEFPRLKHVETFIHYGLKKHWIQFYPGLGADAYYVNLPMAEAEHFFHGVH